MTTALAQVNANVVDHPDDGFAAVLSVIDVYVAAEPAGPVAPEKINRNEWVVPTC